MVHQALVVSVLTVVYINCVYIVILINNLQEQFMLDGDTILVLRTQVWFILAEQLVLTARILGVVPMPSVYQWAQNIWPQLMDHRLKVVSLLEWSISLTTPHQTIVAFHVLCVSLLPQPVTCFLQRLLVQQVGLNSIRDIWWALTICTPVQNTCVWMKHLEVLAEEMIMVFYCIQ